MASKIITVCARLRNLHMISQTIAVTETYQCFFSKWRLCAILDLSQMCLDHPQRVLVVFITAKFGWNRVQFQEYPSFKVLQVWLQMPKQSNK